jgi:hypothetical protein
MSRLILSVPALFVALALQVLPLCRAVQPVFNLLNSPYACVLKLVAGAVTLLGSHHAVSGASTIITSPGTSTGTVNVAYSYRITTGPEQGNTFAASPLPAGLSLNTSLGFITGTPTTAGTTAVLLTASDSGRLDRITTKTLQLTINPPNTPPTISTQPGGRSVNVGSNATFTVIAAGASPLRYQWRLKTTNVVNATNSTLVLTNVQTNQAGAYTVVITNSLGAVTSQVAILTVNVPTPPTPPTPSLVQPGMTQRKITAAFTAAAGFPYTVEYRDLATGGNWLLYTNYPAGAAQTLNFTDSATNALRLYRIRAGQ